MNWKKVVLALVLLDVALMAAVWGVVKFTPSTPMTRAVAEEAQYVKDTLRAEQLRRQVVNTTEFVPPADGRFTAPQVRITLEVWRTADPKLIQARDALWSAHWQSWPTDGRPATAARDAALRTLLKQDLAVNVQAMPGQVAVLNRHHMSLAQYLWLKNAVLEAFGRKAQERIARDVAAGRATIDGPPENTVAVLAQGKPATGALGANVALLASFEEASSDTAGSMVGF